MLTYKIHYLRYRFNLYNLFIDMTIYIYIYICVNMYYTLSIDMLMYKIPYLRYRFNVYNFYRYDHIYIYICVLTCIIPYL